MTKTTVLLVDDHEVVRQGLRALLAAQEDMEVVAEAQDGHQAVTLARETSPDVVVMDISMPGMSGFEFIRKLRALPGKEDVAVVALTGGSTAPPLYAKLRAAGQVPWAKTQIFFTDERAVPPDHELSNYRPAEQGLLRSVKVAGVHRMRGEAADLDAEARRCAQDLRDTLGTPPRLDFMTLGLGPDDLIVVPELAYPTYEVGARLAGAQVARADSLADGAHASSRSRNTWSAGRPADFSSIFSDEPGTAWQERRRRTGRATFSTLIDIWWEILFVRARPVPGPSGCTERGPSRRRSRP